MGHPYRPLLVEVVRFDVYELALELSKSVFAVIEAAELERFFIRDALDRKSTAVPVLVRQGLNTANMHERRIAYDRARKAALECATLLDVLGQRGTIADKLLAPAQAAATLLVDKLTPLTVPPPMTG
jgi:23S rRNA-intervening sequence protein